MTSVRIDLPVSEEKIRGLKAGDFVEIYGVMVTGRDNAHKFLIDEKPGEEYQKLLNGRFIYHCGPVVSKKEKEDGTIEWGFVSAGPTTSAREEPYQADVIGNYKVRGVIGKGGMFEKTLAGLKEHGAVYLHAIGGAGASLAQSVKKVLNVYKLEEFGVPEAFWEIEVDCFKAIVTMDSHGNSLHKDILAKSKVEYERLLKKQ
jgi:fumarate hydratase class I